MPQSPIPTRVFELGMEVWRKGLLAAEQASEELKRRAELLGLAPHKARDKDEPPRIW